MPDNHAIEGILLRMALQQQITTVRRCFDRFFRDKDGHIVIGQFPNAPLFVALFAYLVNMLSTTWVFTVSEVVFVGAIVWWGVLEIWHGDSRFRRVLGALVLLWVCIPRIIGLITG